MTNTPNKKPKFFKYYNILSPRQSLICGVLGMGTGTLIFVMEYFILEKKRK
jgi:hypothetical protein